MLEQKECDHEMALLINKTYEFDKAEALRVEAERQAEIQKQANEKAEARQKAITEQKERDRINEENARMANKAHLRSINNSALLDLVHFAGMDEEQARNTVIAIAKGEISHVSIKY